MRYPIGVVVDKDVDEAIIIEWYKNAGDGVREGDLILHYESLKADADVSSKYTGILVEITAAVGSSITRPPEKPSGGWSFIAGWIEADESPFNKEKISRPATERSEAAGPTEASPERIPAPKTDTEPTDKVRGALEKEPIQKPVSLSADQGAGVKASPFVRKRAKELEIDLSKISGSGPDGSVTVEDLERFQASDKQAPPPPLKEEIRPPQKPETKDIEPEFDLIELGAIRKAIAKNMEKSWREKPHAATSVLINFDNVMKQREELKKLLQKFGDDAVRKYTRLDIVVIEGMIRTLEAPAFAVLNSCFTREGIKQYRHINLGIAVADDRGLLVPVIKTIEGASYRTIADRFDDVYVKLKNKMLRPHDFRGGTVTFNNPGALGGYRGFSIIQPNESIIISLHAIIEGRAELSISFDHRTCDGKEAIEFLKYIKRFVEMVDLKTHVLAQF